MSDCPSEGRRGFLKGVLASTAAAAAVTTLKPVLGTVLADEAKTTEAAFEGREYAFVVDIDKCIGCGKCVQACSLENQVPKGATRTWVERYVGTEEGVYVDALADADTGLEPLDDALRDQAKWTAFVPKLCNHCDNAPCVQVCPVGATFNAPGGFVLVDPEHCIGCGYCIQACPYGVRFLNPETHMADKCSWCYHRVAKGLDPACVTVCPTQARLFGDRNDADSPVAQVFKADQWRVLKPEMYTDCRVYYLGLHREVV
jgi:Fe-S-cluster-containing dehydrogenase component